MAKSLEITITRAENGYILELGSDMFIGSRSYILGLIEKNLFVTGEEQKKLDDDLPF